LTPDTQRPEAPDAIPSGRRAFVRRAAIVTVVAFAVGYLVTAFVIFGGGSGADVVTVPDVRTLAGPAARRALEQVHLQMEIADSLPNARVPLGGVVAQTPLPGQEVSPQTPVRVILSQGPGRRVVPRVDTYSAEHAERILSASGFSVETRNVPDLRAEGRVVGTEPEPGTSLQMPASVRLLVSSGPPRVEVPLVVGMTAGEARDALSAAGLRTGDVQLDLRTDVRDGLVLAQVPVRGDSVRAGSEVRLYVATHQLPEPVEVEESELDDPDAAAPPAGQTTEQ
jgi:eukaryotic-like serine/threonine-protein kinase